MIWEQMRLTCLLCPQQHRPVDKEENAEENVDDDLAGVRKEFMERMGPGPEGRCWEEIVSLPPFTHNQHISFDQCFIKTQYSSYTKASR